MSFYSALITLLLVMDPFGNSAAFIAVLRDIEPARRRWIIFREMCIAFVILVIFLFLGRYILAGLHINQYALSISGGIILFIIALRMIFSGLKDHIVDPYDKEPLIVPLAVPMVAGPSAMAVVILFTTRYPEHTILWFGALVLAWVLSLVVLLFSDYLGRFLGDKGLGAVERLMGLILTVMAVQMFLSGIQDFIQTI